MCVCVCFWVQIEKKIISLKQLILLSSSKFLSNTLDILTNVEVFVIIPLDN